jgi:phosphate ABC transporter permease subunit PstA
VHAVRASGGDATKLHSRPAYHGSYLAIWTALPAILFLTVWSSAERPVLRHLVMQEMPESIQQGSDSERSLTMSVVDSIARGLNELSPDEYEVVRKARYGFVTTDDARDVLARHGIVLGSAPARYLLAAADDLRANKRISRIAMTVLCLLVAASGFVWGFTRIQPELRTRNIVEGVMKVGLMAASTVAVLTTIGIVLSVLFETLHFFQLVSPIDFFFGTVWDPRFSSTDSTQGQFGLLPMLWGTLFISIVALLVAVPVGLFAAIYMSEYAGPKLRATAKPVLEILAGIPTIVYGFFALVTFGPFLRDLGGSAFMMLIVVALSVPIGVAAAVYLEEFAARNRWADLIEVNINNLAAVPSIVFGLLGLAVFINYLGLPRSASLVGGLVLTLMTLPTIIIATRASIKSVPPSVREAALGVGASKMQVITHHVLPLTLPGILTGTIIGLVQALGETAPLLMIGMVAFVVDFPTTPLDPSTALPVQIYMWATAAERGFIERTAGATIVLLAFLIVMNSVAVYLRQKFERKW